jgi:hypothetical protein
MKAPEPHESRLCGAKTRSGGTCKKFTMSNGTGRCRLHGGLSPAGVASPHFKHGRRSKYLKHLPAHLRDNFKRALADPELLSLREEAALLTTRIMDLMDKEAPPSQETWSELRELVQEKTRTASAEWRRLHYLQAVVTVEQALGFAKAFFAAAREVVTDHEMLERLQQRTMYLLPAPSNTTGESDEE